MTLVPRSLARTAAFALAAAMALSACSTSEPADPPTSASSSTTGATSPSPSESTPAPGEWTLDDLKVGAQVPKEDLERLFPQWEKPTPPATLTEESEQGAKDAAVYFSDIVEYAIATHDVTPMNEIDSEFCQNCDALRDLVKTEETLRIFRTKAFVSAVEVKRDPEVPEILEITLDRNVDTYLKLDTARSVIREIEHSSGDDLSAGDTVYQYVVFADGRWQPLFLNLDRSQL